MPKTKKLCKFFWTITKKSDDLYFRRMLLLSAFKLQVLRGYGCFFSEFSPHFLYCLLLSFFALPRSLLRNHTETLATQASWRAFFFLSGQFFFFLTLSDIFKIFILFVCTPHVNFMNNLIYCNNSMICIACEMKICSHMDYQMAFLRLTAIPAIGIAVNRK